MNRNILFVHIPKTAGSSIHRAMYRIGSRTFHKGDDYKRFDNTGSVDFGHRSVWHLLQEGVISPQYFENAFKFTVVRNPWDRLVSLWSFLHQRPPEKRQVGNYTPLEFPEYCKSLANDGIPPLGTYNLIGQSQANPQTAWLYAPDGRLLVDLILRFERPEDFQFLAELTGGQIEHTNVGKHRPYQTYYTPELDAIVRKIYASDIALFGYRGP